MRLPIEYQQVKYIESSGTQYIDTGATITSNIKLKAKFSLTQLGSLTSENVLCSNGNYRTNSFLLLTAGTVAFWFGNNGSRLYTTLEINTKYSVEITKTLVVFNGSANPFLDGGVGNLYLLYASNRGFYGKLYSCQIYDNTTLVRDFIPCYRKSDGEIGLYDLVNDVFYTNAGTGTFTKGADVIYNGTYYPYVMYKKYSCVDKSTVSVPIGYQSVDIKLSGNYGYVDLGSLSWGKDNNYFYSIDLRNLVKQASAQCLCAIYDKTNASIATMPNMTMKFNSSKDLDIVNNSYTDAPSFKTAMSGIYLIYELATPDNPTIVKANDKNKYCYHNSVLGIYDSESETFRYNSSIEMSAYIKKYKIGDEEYAG